MQCLLRCIYVQIDLFATFIYSHVYLLTIAIYLLTEKDLLFAIIYYLQLFIICNYLLIVFIYNVQVFVNYNYLLNAIIYLQSLFVN